MQIRVKNPHGIMWMGKFYMCGSALSGASHEVGPILQSMPNSVETVPTDGSETDLWRGSVPPLAKPLGNMTKAELLSRALVRGLPQVSGEGIRDLRERVRAAESAGRA